MAFRFFTRLLQGASFRVDARARRNSRGVVLRGRRADSHASSGLIVLAALIGLSLALGFLAVTGYEDPAVAESAPVEPVNAVIGDAGDAALFGTMADEQASEPVRIHSHLAYSAGVGAGCSAGSR